MPEPLKLKVWNIPCLCNGCIEETGQCENNSYSDPWQEVELVPIKGQSRMKHRKCKHPMQSVTVTGTAQTQAKTNDDDGSGDENLPDICLDDDPKK